MGAVGGYRLVGGTAMPPLLLDDEEAVAIAVGLRTLVAHAIEGGEAHRSGPWPSSSRSCRHDSGAGWRPSPGPRERWSGTSTRSNLSVLPCSRGPSSTGAACDSSTRPPMGPRPVERSNRIRWSPRAGAGTWSRGTRTAATGGRSGWTGCGSWPLPGHVAPRELPAKDGAAWLRASIEGMAPMAEAVALVEAPARSVAARIPDGAGTWSRSTSALPRPTPRRHDPLAGDAAAQARGDFVVESPPNSWTTCERSASASRTPISRA